MMKNIFLILLLLLTSQCLAFKWFPARYVTEVDSAFANEEAVIIYKKQEMKFNRTGGGRTAYQTELTTLMKVKILSTAGLEKYSTFSFYVPNASEIKTMVARTIKENEVIELDASEIKTENLDMSFGHLDDLSRVKFSMADVAINDELEIVIIEKLDQLEFYGERCLNDELIVLDSEVHLNFPIELKAQIKTYNGMPEPKIKKGIRNIEYTWKGKNIRETYDPRYEFFHQRMPYMRYCVRAIAYQVNGQEAQYPLFNNSWARIYEGHMSYYENRGQDQKKWDQWLDQKMEEAHDVYVQEPKLDQINNILKHILADVEISKKGLSSNLSVGQKVSNKLIDRHGLHVLYKAVFKKVGVIYYLCFGQNYRKGPMDLTFSSPDSYSDAFYAVEDFQSGAFTIYNLPTSKYKYRPGEIPFHLRGTDAVIFKVLKKIKDENAEAIKIPLTDASDNYISRTIQMTINGTDSAQVKYTYTIGGDMNYYKRKEGELFIEDYLDLMALELDSSIVRSNSKKEAVKPKFKTDYQLRIEPEQPVMEIGEGLFSFSFAEYVNPYLIWPNVSGIHEFPYNDKTKVYVVFDKDIRLENLEQLNSVEDNPYLNFHVSQINSKTISLQMSYSINTVNYTVEEGDKLEEANQWVKDKLSESLIFSFVQ